jgi:hypothetical protein
MGHLWEVDHPYYCNEGNFYAPGNDQPCDSHKSWADFLADYNYADFDLNLVFRFDWVEGEDHDLPAYNGDPYYRNGHLKIFWMGQRKGLYRWSTVEVCRADEEAVLAFLKPRWEHLKKLWEPVSP